MTVQKPTGLQFLEQSKFNIYPNPAFDKFNISNIHSVNAKVVMFDLQGKQVLNKQVSQNQVDISSLANGIYSVCLIDNDTILWNKLVKQ